MTSKLPDMNATYCCVPSCDSDTFKHLDSSITLHKFPHDPRQSVKWIQEINSAYKKPHDDTPQWFPKANAVVCSKHFQATDFSNDLLKPNAVPTIFINRTDQHVTCAKQTESPKVAPAVTSKVQETATVAKVKPNDIKDILTRASDLFTKNMAIAKSLKGTIPAPLESAEVNTSISSDSSDLPELSLDMSLADLQSKLSAPVKTHNNDLKKDNESMPTNNSDVTKVSGKRKLEADSQFEFIKIGENKYLKIQRKSSSLTNKSENSILKSDDTSSLVAMLSKDCTPGEKQNIIEALDKYSMSQSISINSKTNLDSSTTSVPKTITSCNEGKLKDDSQSEFIAIGNGKYLKISRVPANTPLHSTPIKKTFPKGIKKSTNSLSNGSKKPTNIHPQSSDKSVNSDPEGDVVMCSDIEEPCDEDLSKLPETSEVSNANVAVTDSISSILTDKIIDTTVKSDAECGSSKQPESLKTTDSINKSPKKSLNLGKSKKKPSIKKEKSSKKASIKHERSFFKFGKMPMFKLTLEEENELLKTKIKELEKRSLMPINQQTSLEKDNILLKKEVERLRKEYGETQKVKDNVYKKLKTISEESSKGDASATYILDQINAFGSKMQKYSNSTYLHCALLCRKNAQAYELFRKAELFSLPTFNTVDRYLRRHPNVSLSGKSNPGDSKHDIITSSPNKYKPNILKNPKRAPIQVLANSPRCRVQSDHTAQIQQEMSTMEVDTSNSDLREVVLETGEVVQCYSSDICVGEDGHQYFIMREDQDKISQDEYVPNSAGQLQYTETEVAIATGMIS